MQISEELLDQTFVLFYRFVPKDQRRVFNEKENTSVSFSERKRVDFNPRRVYRHKVQGTKGVRPNTIRRLNRCDIASLMESYGTEDVFF